MLEAGSKEEKMKRIFFALHGIITLLIFLLSCSAPKEAVRGAPVGERVPLIQEEKQGWEVEWERTLKAAKTEGRLSIVSTFASPYVRTALSDGFKKKYGIEVEVIAGKGSEVAAKISSERRAGLYLID